MRSGTKKKFDRFLLKNLSRIASKHFQESPQVSSGIFPSIRKILKDFFWKFNNSFGKILCNSRKNYWKCLAESLEESLKLFLTKFKRKPLWEYLLKPLKKFPNEFLEIFLREFPQNCPDSREILWKSMEMPEQNSEGILSEITIGIHQGIFEEIFSLNPIETPESIFEGIPGMFLKVFLKMLGSSAKMLSICTK